MSDNAHEEAHTGPIKTPKQLLVTVFFSFVVPIFVIIGLVLYVVSAANPASSPNPTSMSLGGVSEQAHAQGVAHRLMKVGSIEIRDANRPLQAGEAVFKAQCAACHATGAAGAPKLGDVGAWAARIKTGYEALLNSALKGKGAMAPQAGGDFEDVEIGRAVVYMANAAGAKFAEPQRPAAPATAEGAAPAAGAAVVATPAAPTSPSPPPAK
ncbi:c-type cytochrome [Variovorax sp. VNK109]|jgi:cytochrome c5|uniref:c-type cytochrome n=1 Tax=Variovorax sp. VNK109 TaxID=3400919 RepID=UPI003C1140F1